MHSFPPGLYDLLRTPLLLRRLQDAGQQDHAKWKTLDDTELLHRFCRVVAEELGSLLVDAFKSVPEQTLAERLRQVLTEKRVTEDVLPSLLPDTPQILHRIASAGPDLELARPDTPLAVSALLTGSSRSPALRTQLQKELASCDRADWLVSFIKYAGILPLMETLQRFTQTPAPGGGPRLRIATTSYMGATDAKAVEELLKLSHTEIRVSYDTKRTRLHAKAYLFHRATGFGSAYIGSANISRAALDEGLEWTAKISQYETPHLWKAALGTFDSHWEDSTEFTPCTLVDLPQLRTALAQEAGTAPAPDITFFDLRPYDYQRAILQDIAAERQADKRRHLIIAATGTGKTMVAAFDYKNFADHLGGRPHLLFVAHREEILNQARAAFRQVLRDGSFGQIITGGVTPTQYDHLFCTVQSWNSRDFSQFPRDYFPYVVLDEAHHAPAASYQRLVGHVTPLCLLGLTATPERSDGKDIRNDFGGAFTHEIRLTEAIDRALLTPFHYFGIPDAPGVDFSRLSWVRGGYDQRQLANMLDANDLRANWVLNQVERHVAALARVRGLGFCVSVEHANFMADYFTRHNVPAVALSAESPKEQRHRVQQDLAQRRIRFIFSVDLYNEGVDIPCVDTVLFLRPTESLTIFLQQLGRGLRLHDDKAQLTVLDFIAPQHRNFSYAKRFHALSSRPTGRIDHQISAGMPFVPAGCLVHLENQAREHVLRNLRDATSRLRGQRLLTELRALQCELERQQAGPPGLQQILDHLQLDDPDALYRVGLPHRLLAQAAGEHCADDAGLHKGFRRLLLMDDTHFLEGARQTLRGGEGTTNYPPELLHSVLWSNQDRSGKSLDGVIAYLRNRPALTQDLLELLDWLLSHRGPLPEIATPPSYGPLRCHASYTREQVLLALGLGSFEEPRSSREGVLHIPERQLDVFFADINKSEEDFSPTTMYDDYALTDRLFHWQSQSGTSDTSPVGQRYIHHERQGYTPLLFIRERNKLANGLRAPYLFAGGLRYKRHEGSKPMSIIWELTDAPLPARILAWARRAG